MKQWWKDRLNSLIDNLLWVALAVVAVGLLGTVGAIWAWGNDEAHLPVWAVVLFGAVQLVTVLAVIVLFLRVSKVGDRRQAPQEQKVVLERFEEPPPPHPQQRLLDQIDALDASIRHLEPYNRVSWPVASAFNELLAECQSASNSSTLYGIEDLRSYGTSDANADFGTVIALLGQMRAVIQNTG